MLSYFNEAANKYLDIHDAKTRKVILSVDESDQNSILLSLTGKLYQMIIDKIDEIDFGDIPESAGDVTMLNSYDKIVDSIDTLTKILQQYKQPLDTIDQIRAALDNLENDRDLYKRGFQFKVDIIITTYNTIVLGIISSIAYMIAVTVDFIKNPNSQEFKLVFMKAGVARTKDSLVYSNLVSFNQSCRKGQIRNAFTPLLKAKVKNFAASTLATIAAGMAIASIVINILPILREMTYYFFVGRVRISQYFDLQADLLEMNASSVLNGDEASVSDAKRVANKQISIASRFRKLANFFAINDNKADKAASKMIKDDSKAMNIDDVVDSAPDSSMAGSLF